MVIFSLICAHPFTILNYTARVDVETRLSGIVSNASLSPTPVWEVCRLTFADEDSHNSDKRHEMKLDSSSLTGDAIASLLSAFSSLQTFEFISHSRSSKGYRLGLLSLVREALQNLPSLRLVDEPALEGGDFSKLKIVRFTPDSDDERYGE